MRLRRRLLVGSDWPVMSLIFTTPTRTMPVVLGATGAGTGGVAAAAGLAAGAGVGSGSGADSSCEPEDLPPATVDVSITWQPGGISKSGGSRVVVEISTTSVVISKVP